MLSAQIWHPVIAEEQGRQALLELLKRKPTLHELQAELLEQIWQLGIKEWQVEQEPEVRR